MARKKPTLLEQPGTEEDSLEIKLLKHVASRLSAQGTHEDSLELSKSFHSFVLQAWNVVNPGRPLIDAWYVGCLTEHLQALFEKQILRLVINCPPSFGKSLFCSVLFPSWIWTHTPEFRSIFSTYGDELSVRDSLRTRDVITSLWYKERWGQCFSLKEDQNTKHLFHNDRQGFRMATTVSGKGIGFKTNLFAADDPHKQSEIHSDTKRMSVIDWWGKTVSTRGEVQKDTLFLIVMQRLKENDLAGHALSSDLGYESLILPMEYESHRVLYSFPLPNPLPRDAIVPTLLQFKRPELRDPRTEDGELLCEGVMDRQAVDQLKKELQGDAPGQLQQRPSLEEGAVFQKVYFRYFEVVRHQGETCIQLGETGDSLTKYIAVRKCRFFQTIDTAASIKDTAAYTAIGTFAITPTYDLIVWHVWRARLQVMELFEATQCFRHGPHRLYTSTEGRTTFVPDGAPWPVPLLCQAVENKSTGIGLIQQGQAYGNPFEILKADGDKVLRSRTLATLYHNGKVWHRKGAQWIGFFEDEMLSFPNGKTADMADMASYAGILVTHNVYFRKAVDHAVAYVNEEERDLPIHQLLNADLDGSRFVLYVGNGEVLDIQFDD